MAVSIGQVFFEHHTVALGIGEDRPRISWSFEGEAQNWTQTGYSLEVNRGGSVELFDFNDTSESHLVPWPTVALSSAESASVRVRAYGRSSDEDAGSYEQPATPWSNSVTVETGLLSQDDWTGVMMIGAAKATQLNETKRPVLFRKEFAVADDAPVASARLYVTAYGLYEAYINGQRVGDRELAPGFQSYNHRLVYDTYDVTDLVRGGEDNVLGAKVGEGWYAGVLMGGDRDIWGDTLGIMAKLVIVMGENSQEVVTNLNWRSGAGPIMSSEIYNGETYDARLEGEVAGWSSPGFSKLEDTNESGSKKWIGVKELASPVGRLAAPDGPPIRRLEEVTLKEVIQSPSGKTILDFGQNLVGWLQIKVDGPAGQVIKLVHVEVLENGEIATAPLRKATETDYLVLSGNGTVKWEPTFTYHGFRYVQVDGWPTAHTPLDGNAVTAVVVHTDMRRTGTFECSDALINKLHQNVIWSMKGNFMSIPTDCPQRDERVGWTGDAHAFAPTANFLYDTAGFWRGWMRDVHSEQMERDGVPPIVVPKIPSISQTGATAVWGDVVVANAWNSYLATGDLDMLREEYVGAKAWLDIGIPRTEPRGLWNRTTFQFGDWLDPLAPPDDPGQATTAHAYVADAYLVYVTDLVAKMAVELKLPKDATEYSNWAAELRQKFQKAWINADGTTKNETQTGLALPLYFNLFANASQAKAAAQRLDAIIARNDYLVGTGFAGTHLLGLAMTRYNLTATFYRMLLQTRVPSWLYQVEMGGTTTWERWDSMLPNGTLNTSGMTSFNHYAFGSVANWIHQVVGGLAPAEPGWRTVRVRVVPGGGITSAKTSFQTPYGAVLTDWKVDADGFRLVLKVPPNSRAEVILPGLSIEGKPQLVGSGTYEFSVPVNSC